MRLLFVSELDQCRGPMARVVAERLAQKEGLFEVVFDSAGLSAKPDGPQIEAAAFLRTEKINIAAHRSKPLNEALADGADIILTMTREQAKRAKQMLGPELAPKVVQLTEAIDLDTKRIDVESPAPNATELRRLYASLCASMGRLIRMLEEPDCTPEYFGAKSIPKRHAHGTAGAGARASESTIDPKKRQYIAGLVFDLVERSLDPPTIAIIHEQLALKGVLLSTLELEEVLQQDLHGYVQKDRDGSWVSIAGAAERRKRRTQEEARARAAATAQQARAEQEAKAQSEAPPPPRPARGDDEMPLEEAFQTLNITPETNVDEGRRKYRDLLKRYHPDRFMDDPSFREMAELKTKKINSAWKILQDRLPAAESAGDEEVRV